MRYLSNRALDLIDAAADAPSAAEVGRRFFAALRPYGVRAIYARRHRSADGADVTAYSRISPPGWEALYAERQLHNNFLTREIRRRVEPFRWSDVLQTDTDRELFASLGPFGIDNGVAAPVHGPGGYVGVTSLAFERMDDIAPADRRAIGAAGLVLHLRMMQLTPSAAATHARLAPRERDCLGLVAEGRSDWEIGERLGIAETTVISHMQAARRKLGARTRAQAVALALMAGLI